MSEPKYLWKSMKEDLKSAHGKVEWEKDRWQKESNITLCHKGFHASKFIVDAMRYVNCSILAKVEVRGEGLKENDKEVWSEMVIREVYQWTKEDSIKLAIFAARLVLPIFEKYDSKDLRPRKAIDAAETYLKNPSKKTQNAAGAYAAGAYAAYTAYAAAYAAADAYAAYTAYTAYAAANAANAAYSAAYAAYAYAAYAYAADAAVYDAYAYAADAYAADAAADAADAAAYDAAAYDAAKINIKKQCQEFILNILEEKNDL